MRNLERMSGESFQQPEPQWPVLVAFFLAKVLLLAHPGFNSELPLRELCWVAGVPGNAGSAFSAATVGAAHLVFAKEARPCQTIQHASCQCHCAGPKEAVPWSFLLRYQCESTGAEIASTSLRAFVAGLSHVVVGSHLKQRAVQTAETSFDNGFHNTQCTATGRSR